MDTGPACDVCGGSAAGGQITAESVVCPSCLALINDDTKPADSEESE